MFAVMGITGKVGGAVARALIEAGSPVRAIVRDAGKGEAWAARGCQVAVADLDDAEALGAAFAGCDGAFVMLPPLFDPAPGFPEAKAMIATLRAALDRARPGKVVALSTIGADAGRPNLLSQLALLEAGLADLAMPVAFLRPAWFIENAAWDVASARGEGVIRSYLLPLDRPIPMVSADDVGRTAADVLQETRAGRRVVELEAAQRVTPNDLAAAFAKALGHPVRAESVEPACWDAIFRQQGMSHPTPRIQMLEGFNAGWIDFPDQGKQARKGRVSLDQAISALVA